ncbi:hypothetical protein BsWGS_19036 [Bradybaena similaris]
MSALLSRFQSGNDDHMIDVNLGDRLNILCPEYKDNTIPMNQWEYYLIYMVDKHNYEVCVINDTSNKIPILNCSNPEFPKIFKLLIFEFQPIPGIPDFQIGKDYYFISTSGGRKFNINNQYEGACKEHQMKMILRVRPKTTEVVIDNGVSINKSENSHQPTTQPRSPTLTTTTTTSRTTEATQGQITRRTLDDSHTDKTVDGDPVPGLDGFPDDETIIRREGPSLNSGIIADTGMDNSMTSIHNVHKLSIKIVCAVLFWNLILTLLVVR